MKEGTLFRIKKYLDYKGISNRAFEMQFGFSNGSFASQLKNGKTIGVDRLENILNEYTDIDIEWLLTGHGDMLRKERSAQEVKPVVIYKSDPKDADLITAKNSIIALQEDKIRRLESLLMQHSTVLDIARSADLPSQQTEGTKPHKKHD